MSDWISVKDRLPEANQPFWSYWVGMEFLPVMLNYGAHSPRDYFTQLKITHWMPATLPAPPKSEAEIALSAAWAAKPGWGASDYSSFKSGFLAGWQAHEKRGEG